MTDLLLGAMLFLAAFAAGNELAKAEKTMTRAHLAVLYTLALVALLIAVLAYYTPAAHARNAGQWDTVDARTRQWFKDQKVPNGPGQGQSCCSDADGEEVQEDLRDGNYWIKGGKFSEWTEVPPNAVIQGPNLHGQPVVWARPSPYYNGIPQGQPSIVCYAPGAGI